MSSCKNSKSSSLFNRVKSPQYIEPLNQYKENLICQDGNCNHQEISQAKLLFRSRWGKLHDSLREHWKSDFQVSLTIETCPGLVNYQSENYPIDEIHSAFKLKHSCLFPLNNAYVCLDDVVNSLKFVVSKEEEISKLKPFFKECDYLFFIQNLDLRMKRCHGGLIFQSGKNLIVILIDDCFTFFMDDSDISLFIDAYKSYAAKEFRIDALKNHDISFNATDNRLFQIGARENKFNLLRFEVFRETLEDSSVKSLKNPIPEFFIQLTISLRVRSIHPDQYSLLRSTWHCFSDQNLQFITLWYLKHLGIHENYDQFNFVNGFPPKVEIDYSSLAELCSHMRTKLTIEVRPPKRKSLLDYRSCLFNIDQVDRLHIARLHLAFKDDSKAQSTKVNLLMVSINDSLCEIVKKALPSVNLKETLFLFENNSKTIVVPSSFSLANLKFIYGKPKNGFYEISLIRREQLDRIDKTSTDYLNLFRDRFLSDRVNCGENHFDGCPDDHQFIWHGQIIFDSKSDSFHNMMFFSCGNPLKNVFDEETEKLYAFKLGQQSEMSFFEEFKNGGRILTIVWCSQVDPDLKYDATSSVVEMVNHQVYVLKDQSRNGIAFLVSFLGHNFVFFPKNPSVLEALILEDADIVNQMKIIPRPKRSKTSKRIFIPFKDELTIRPTNFKFANKTPLSKASEDGIEGLVLFTHLKSLPKSIFCQLLKHQFVEIYDCPKFIGSGTLQDICLEDRHFHVKFENLKHKNQIFKNGKYSIATSLCLESESKDLSSHVLIVLQYDEVTQMVVGFLPKPETQEKLLKKLWDQTSPEDKPKMNVTKSSSKKKGGMTRSKSENVPKETDQIFEHGSFTGIQFPEATIVTHYNDDGSKLYDPFNGNQRLKLAKLLEILLNRFADAPRPVLNKIRYCYHCAKPATIDSLICLLCDSGLFCDDNCFEEVRSLHKLTCTKFQADHNRKFLDTL